MDHYKRHTLSFDKVQTVVLDEADRMLDMGFFDDVTKIIEKVKNRRNLGLFSATISQEVMTVSWMYQRDEVEITVPFRLSSLWTGLGYGRNRSLCSWWCIIHRWYR